MCGETPFLRVIRGLWPRLLNYDNRTRDLDGQRTPLQDLETLYIGGAEPAVMRRVLRRPVPPIEVPAPPATMVHELRQAGRW